MIRGKRNLLIIAVIIVVATAAYLLFYYKTQTAWVDSPPYRRVSESPTHTLVVVYSRTGNTMSAAKEAASYFDADLLQILAPQYARTIKGLQLASQHADQEVTTTPIQHEPVDLSRYDMIFCVHLFGGFDRRFRCGLLSKIMTLQANRCFCY